MGTLNELYWIYVPINPFAKRFSLESIRKMLNAVRFLLHDISLGYIKLWAFLYQEAVIYGLNFNLIKKL